MKIIMIKSVSVQSFKNEVLGSSRPVLVDFFASWCSPCKMLAPVIDEVGAELDDVIDIAKVDIDTDANIADYYSVSSVPTLILINKGDEKVRLTGAVPKDTIMSAITEYINE